MDIRRKTILEHDFFINKQDLGEQLLQFEQDGHGFLPNDLKNLYLDFTIGNTSIRIGRINHYYYLAILKENEKKWTYQAFPSKLKFTQFIIHSFQEIEKNVPPEEQNIIKKQKHFWLYQIERISTD